MTLTRSKSPKKATHKRSPVRKSTLGNGVRLYSERVKGFQSVSLGVWVRGGSRHETESQAGYAHFLEHMLFKGTSNYSALDIARFTDEIGGEFNAMTSREYTCFHINMPKRSIKEGIHLIADILQNSLFDKEEIKREQNVVLQEMAMLDESAEELLFDRQMELAFPKHPIGRQILGHKKSVRAITQSKLRNYFKRHYNFENIVVTIAGDIEHNAIKKQLAYEFPKKARVPARKLPAASLRKPKFHPGVHTLMHNSDNSHLLLSFEGLPIGHKDRFALFLLNSFLGGGMSSRLFQSVREENGLAYSVYSAIPSFLDCGLASFYVAAHRKTIPQCLHLINGEIRRLQTELISEEDLRVVKNSIKNAIAMDSDSMESRMFAMARSAVFDQRYLTNEQLGRDIDKINPTQLRVIAQRIFSQPYLLTCLGRVRKTELLKAMKP